MRPVEALPAKCCWISERAATESRAGRLPAGAGERGLDARSEEAEPDREDDPGDRDGARVCRGVAAEAADRAELSVLRRSSRAPALDDRTG